MLAKMPSRRASRSLPVGEPARGGHDLIARELLGLGNTKWNRLALQRFIPSLIDVEIGHGHGRKGLVALSQRAERIDEVDRICLALLRGLVHFETRGDRRFAQLGGLCPGQRSGTAEREGEGQRVAHLRLPRRQVGRNLKVPDGSRITIGPSIFGYVLHRNQERLRGGVDLFADQLLLGVGALGKSALQGNGGKNDRADLLRSEGPREIVAVVRRRLPLSIATLDRLRPGAKGHGIILSEE